jgi:hypothetical protein
VSVQIFSFCVSFLTYGLHAGAQTHKCRRYKQRSAKLCSTSSPQNIISGKMPAIKIEEASPEPLRTPKATTASFDTAVETWERSFERNMRGVKPLMPPPPTEPYAAATQTHLVPTLYCGSSPRKYRLTAPDSSTGRLNVLSPPFSMRLPPQSDPVIATRRVNKTTATTTTSYHASTPQPTQVSHLGHSSRDKSNTTTSTRDKMDENDFDYDEAFTEYNGFPSMLIQGMIRSGVSTKSCSNKV